MARRRKTSLTPKKKIHVPKPPPPRPKYADHIEEFIQKVEALQPSTPLCNLKVRVDRYHGSETYSVSVNRILFRSIRCLWASSGDTKEDLEKFWVSAAYRDLNI